MTIFSSIIDLGLNSVSQVEDENTQFELNNIYSALNILNQALQTVTTITCVTGIVIQAGQLVNIYNNSGVLTARLADATDNSKPANGFCSSITTPSSGLSSLTVTALGANPYMSLLTVGSMYYLSTTPGTVTDVPPSTSGNLLQIVGQAIDSNTLFYTQNNSTSVV